MIGIKKTESYLSIEEKAYHKLLEDHQEFSYLPPLELKGHIHRLLKELKAFDKASVVFDRLPNLSEKICENITAIWVFSGPDPTNPYYVGEKAYMAHMDRERRDFTFRIARYIAREKSKGDHSAGDNLGLMKRYSPIIIYNGNDGQNDSIKEELGRSNSFVPAEKLVVQGVGLKNTTDQVRTFILPEECHVPDKEILLISHAPHLVRIAHMLGFFKTIPEDMKIRFLPIKSPLSNEEYFLMELSGLLTYILLTEPQQASLQSCKYLLGNQE